jgi:hypothetical protein
MKLKKYCLIKKELRSAGGFMINKYYLQNLGTIKASFLEKKDFPHVLLFDFLWEREYLRVKKQVGKISLKREKKPMFHSYAYAPLSLGLQKIFSSPEFTNFITKVIAKKLNLSNAQIYSFSARDYTLLNDSYQENAGIDIIFDFTEKWDASCGGQITYVNGTGDALKLPIQKNSLMIIRRQKNVQRFVKYVNHKAGKKRRVFVLVRFN